MFESALGVGQGGWLGLLSHGSLGSRFEVRMKTTFGNDKSEKLKKVLDF